MFVIVQLSDRLQVLYVDREQAEKFPHKYRTRRQAETVKRKLEAGPKGEK